MAKSTGLAWTELSVDDSSGMPQDIRNDVTNLTFATPRASQDVTGVDKSAHERLLLLADFTVTLNGVFNPETDMSHDVLKTIPSTSVNRTVTLETNGQTLAGEMILTDYTLTRAAAGELTWSTPGSLADGTTPSWS